MSVSLDLFVEAARAVSIEEAAGALKLRFTKKRHEHPQPCPACGGKDCFSFNTQKNVWNCRGAAVGGKDAIGMAAHVNGLDAHKRPEFLEACALVTGLPVPDEAGQESGADRAARLRRLEQQRLENERRQVERENATHDFRAREQAQARGIWERADVFDHAPIVRGYLERRLNKPLPSGVRLHLRQATSQTYWHGRDERGFATEIHCGPAMIGVFLDADGQPFGCHITWIDLKRRPKFRPMLGPDEKGKALPAKKMRGSKKGGLIPVFGEARARRWIVGEGIETVTAVAWAEEFRADTFYCAAGDLGNLTGPPTRAGRYKHPALTKTNKNGRTIPVMVASPFPDPARLREAFPILPHVRECILLGERDSEPEATASAMARGKGRIELLVPDCAAAIAWPPGGKGDFCELVSEGTA